MTLITDSELAALQGLVLSGLKTTVYVYNAVNVETADGQESTFPSTPSATVLGWLYEMTPDSATISVIDGGGALSEMFRLLVPIGTNIQSGDKIVIGSSTYFAQHTSAENTYPTSLSVSLRILV